MKCSFLLFKASHLGIKNPSPKHVFPRRLPGQPFLLIIRTWSIWDPFRIQWAPKWDPKSTKWHPEPSFFFRMGVPLSGPDLLMHIGRALAHFWYPFSSNWLPVTFRIIFHVFMFLTQTFEPSIAKHGPHPPIK